MAVMKRHGKFSDLAKEIDEDPARRGRVDADLAAYSIGEALQRLREQHALTQSAVAGRLNRTQGNVSRIEHQEVVDLGTLAAYLEAIDGKLEIAAVFGEERVSLPVPASSTE